MHLNLKILDEKKITQKYIKWFADDEMVRYSDQQYEKITYETQQKYVIYCLENTNTDLYGIFDHDTHIGNIRIIGLNSFHHVGEITYMVGDKNYRGKGVGSFAISEMIKEARSYYKLHKLSASVAHLNFARTKILEKNGFLLEGVRIKHLIYGKRYCDQLDYGLIL